MTEFEKSNYDVGYKKPPKSTQFKKGQSGNPKGRPKLYKPFKEDLLEELQETITTKENGKEKIITKQKGVIKRIMNSALSGNVQAYRIFVHWFSEYCGITAEKDSSISADDRKIIEEYIAKEIKND